jgi:hypothetical protein
MFRMFGGYNTTQMKVAIALAISLGRSEIYLVSKTDSTVYKITITPGLVPTYGKKGTHTSTNLGNIKSCKFASGWSKNPDGTYDGDSTDCTKHAVVNIKNFHIEVPGSNNTTIIIKDNANVEDMAAAEKQVKKLLIDEGFTESEVGQVTPTMALTILEQVDIVPSIPTNNSMDQDFYQTLRSCDGIDSKKSDTYNLRRLQMCFHPDKNLGTNTAPIFQLIMNNQADIIRNLFRRGADVATIPSRNATANTANLLEYGMKMPAESYKKPDESANMIEPANYAPITNMIKPANFETMRASLPPAAMMAPVAMMAHPTDEEMVVPVVNAIAAVIRQNNPDEPMSLSDVAENVAKEIIDIVCKGYECPLSLPGNIVSAINKAVKVDVYQINTGGIPWTGIFVGALSALVAAKGQLGGRRKTSKKSHSRRRKSRTGKRARK